MLIRDCYATVGVRSDADTCGKITHLHSDLTDDISFVRRLEHSATRCNRVPLKLRQVCRSSRSVAVRMKTLLY